MKIRAMIGIVAAVSALHGMPDDQSVFPPPAKRPAVHAVRAYAAPVIDGRLSEPDWQRAGAARHFTQIEPYQGNKPSFDTEVRLLYDANYLYVGALCRDTTGARGVRVLNLRRDFDYFQNDLFGVTLDAFGDGRSCVSFQVNPYGALYDLQVIDGQVYNRDWDDRWQARTTVTDSGWMVETAIPWSTLRYPQAENPQWRINFVRNIRRNNEITGWSPWPRVYNPYRMDYAGVLTGIEPPPPGKNIRLQPYTVMRRNSTRTAGTARHGNESAIGGEVKWAMTPNTIIDLTVNTDFAQADADRQVINTSRFSVFFPEKRQFFLENANLFALGHSATVMPFFSRRIGLDRFGQPIAIDAGLRLISRNPEQNLGALLIRQRGNEDNPASTFAVGRYSKNLGERNRLGAMITHRSDESMADAGAVHNTVASVDGLFRFSPTLSFVPMFSRSWTHGAEGNGYASHVWIYNDANWGYVGHWQAFVTRNYNAASGFVRRQDFILTSPAVSLDWRPRWRPAFIHKLAPGFTSFFYHRASDRKFQEGFVTLRPLNLVFRNGGWLAFHVVPNWQRLEPRDVQFFKPFGVALAAGNYTYWRYLIRTGSDQSRRMAASVFGTTGGYFNGTRQELGIQLKYAPSPLIALTVDYEFNQVSDLGMQRENATTHLLGSVLRLALNPRVQMFAFYQYNSFARNSVWNVRFAWEFAPLSYVYLVFNDSRVLEGAPQASPASARQVVLKFTYQIQI